MKRLICAIVGHHNVRTLGLLDPSRTELVCLRCMDRRRFRAASEWTPERKQAFNHCTGPGCTHCGQNLRHRPSYSPPYRDTPGNP